MTSELELHRDFRVSIVIPVGPGEFRKVNLRHVLETLEESTFPFQEIIVVGDGWLENVASVDAFVKKMGNAQVIVTPKHHPGMEQPRNIGVRHISTNSNYVWFLDSDCLVLPETLHEYAKAANAADVERILIGPYDWMDSAAVVPRDYGNDPRWAMFREKGDITKTWYHDLGVALGNFSGNLVWPIEQFRRVGGFWDDLHTGRCEDGELGVRASAMGVGMCLVPEAKAYHMGGMGGHGDPEILAKNTRDVPMINERHPYIQEQGIVMVDADGIRFNRICENCGASVNTGELWSHREKCYNEVTNVLDAKT